MKKICGMTIASTLAVCACSTIPEETQAALDKPVNCETAEEDIAVLEDALPGGRAKARAVIRSVTPAGLVMGAVSRDLRDRAKVVSGTLEADLYNKMADIYEECDLEPAEISEEVSASAK
ncbi:MAG: hypothetical protein AAFV51_01375 [Pseudomonadota bacterium]